jgi:hypothetical protein
MRMTTRLQTAVIITILGLLFFDFHLGVADRDAFSWMDPYQYYEFARDVMHGTRAWSEFALPSIFPFFVLPALLIHESIPSALWTNMAFMLILAAAIFLLCRTLEIRSPLVAVTLTLSSPLLLGLSRSLYVEFALTTLVAIGLLAWLRWIDTAKPVDGLLLALCLGVGFMTKMTYPLFFLVPLAGCLIEFSVRRRWGRAIAAGMILLIPSLLVLVIQYLVFPRSFVYYTNFGNTQIPIMRLIGPPEWLSWDSLFYYYTQTGKTLLFVITPFLVLPALQALRSIKRHGVSDLTDPRATLWLFLLGPLTLLILQPVKEPRHVAPCVIPAVLLIARAIQDIRFPILRNTVSIAAVILAAAQYGLVTRQLLSTPYFMRGAIHIEEISEMLLDAEPATAIHRMTPLAEQRKHWAFTRNFVVSGFEPNVALALNWQLMPGIVYDLDTLTSADVPPTAVPYQKFEDLYLLTAFNTYNRRIGWHGYLRTLDREDVLEHADVVLVQGKASSDLESRLHDFELTGTIDAGDDTVRVFTSYDDAHRPYRELYAMEFLRRSPNLPPIEMNTVQRDRVNTAVLRGDFKTADALLARYPGLPPFGTAPTRNIYWIRTYVFLHRLVVPKLYEYHRAKRGSN